MFVCLSFFSDNSDLIACMVVSKDGGQAQRFLAVDVYQMSLVEPETKRLGWGVVKFAGLLQVNEMQRVPVCLCGSMCGSMCVSVHSSSHVRTIVLPPPAQASYSLWSLPDTDRMAPDDFFSLCCVDTRAAFSYFKCAIMSQLILHIIHGAHSSSSSCSSSLPPFASTGHAGVWCWGRQPSTEHRHP